MMQTVAIRQCLSELGYAVVPVTGTSMWPLLKEGKSQVQLTAGEGKNVRKGDIVLYQRYDGTLVLHRVLKVAEEDTFLVCGDHQWKLEEKIHKEQILAIAQGFYKNGKYIDDYTWWYRLYKGIWNGNLTLRRCCLAFLRLSGMEKRSLK